MPPRGAPSNGIRVSKACGGAISKEACLKVEPLSRARLVDDRQGVAPSDYGGAKALSQFFAGKRLLDVG